MADRPLRSANSFGKLDRGVLARDPKRGVGGAARQPSPYERGWRGFDIDTVPQADQGCDLDLRVGKSRADVTREFR